MALSEKELRFCREYAADPNAVQAYLRAFPHCTYKTALGNANKLLNKPGIQVELKATRKEYFRKARVRAVRVLRDLANVAHADPYDVLERGPSGEPQVRDWDTIVPAARKTIQKIKTKRRRLTGGGGSDDSTEWEVEEIEVTFKDTLAAADKLCKHLGLTKDGAALEELLAALGKAPEGDQPDIPPVGPGGGHGPVEGEGADSPPDDGGPGPDAVPG